MNAVKKDEIFTIDNIFALPDDVRAELIDGEIYYMSPTPTSNHQRLVHFFDRLIGNYIYEKNGPCEVFPAPFSVFLDDDIYTYLEPDISVICNPDKIDDKGCHGAPDWIIEIVSPSNRQHDYMIKQYKYRDAGVREYWIVDIEKNRITVYNFEHETMGEYSFNDTVKAGIYEDLEIDFTQVRIS